MKIVLKFKRKNSWPCSVEENTPTNEVYEKEIEESETYIRDGIKYYNMLCGHGISIEIPVDGKRIYDKQGNSNR